MGFWGVVVKPGEPVIHSCIAKGGVRITRATLGIGNAVEKSLVLCNVGRESPVILCALLPNVADSCHLDLEFEEANDVIFSVIGPGSVHLVGYFLCHNHADKRSFGVDIVNTEIEKSTQHIEDDKYKDNFVDASELPVQAPSPVTCSRGKKKKRKANKNRCKWLKTINQVIDHKPDDADDSKLQEKDYNEDSSHLLSMKMTMMVSAEEGNSEAKIGNGGSCESKEKEEIDSPVEKSFKQERGKKTKEEQKKEIPQEMEMEMEPANNEYPTFDCNLLEDPKALGIDVAQDLPTDKDKDHNLPDLSVNPKRKWKDEAEEDTVVVVENDKTQSAETMPFPLNMDGKDKECLSNRCTSTDEVREMKMDPHDPLEGGIDVAKNKDADILYFEQDKASENNVTQDNDKAQIRDVENSVHQKRKWRDESQSNENKMVVLVEIANNSSDKTQGADQVMPDDQKIQLKPSTNVFENDRESKKIRKELQLTGTCGDSDAVKSNNNIILEQEEEEDDDEMIIKQELGNCKVMEGKTLNHGAEPMDDADSNIVSDSLSNNSEPKKKKKKKKSSSISNKKKKKKSKSHSHSHSKRDGIGSLDKTLII